MDAWWLTVAENLFMYGTVAENWPIWKSTAAEAKHGMKIERITVQKDSITYQSVSWTSLV